MKNVLPSVCFVIVYIGVWPVWMPLFLESCRLNKRFNWLIFGDHTFSGRIPKNVQFQRLSLFKFNEFARQRTGLPFNVQRPYKICDARGMFGRIFEKDLQGFDFWGQTDIDLVYGDLDSFGIRKVLDGFDIWAPYDTPVGHFTLFKNIDKVNNLFQKFENLEFSCIDTLSLWGFDELLLGKLIEKNKDIHVKYANYRKELLKKRCAVGASIMPYGQVLGERLSAGERYQWKDGKAFQLNGKRRREFMYLHFFMWKGSDYWRRLDHHNKVPREFWLDASGYATRPDQLMSTNGAVRVLKFSQYTASRIPRGLRWVFIFSSYFWHIYSQKLVFRLRQLLL